MRDEELVKLKCVLEIWADAHSFISVVNVVKKGFQRTGEQCGTKVCKLRQSSGTKKKTHSHIMTSVQTFVQLLHHQHQPLVIL